MRWWEAWELAEVRGWARPAACAALAGEQTLSRLHKPHHQTREGKRGGSRQLGHPAPIVPASAPALGTSVAEPPSQPWHVGAPQKSGFKPPSPPSLPRSCLLSHYHSSHSNVRLGAWEGLQVHGQTSYWADSLTVCSIRLPIQGWAGGGSAEKGAAGL